MNVLNEVDVGYTSGKILEELRQKLATIAGVTLVGNRVTVRFYGKEDRQRKYLLEVSMVVVDVDDGLPEPPEETPQ